MRSMRPTTNASIPTLRTLEDAKAGVDLEQVVDLAKLYELGINTSHDEHNARAGVWHPSSCGHCMLSQVLHYTKTPPTDRQSSYLKEIFEVGHFYHEIIQRRFAALGPAIEPYNLHYDFQAEVSYDPETDALFREHQIGGTCDGIIRIWDDSFEQRGVLEVKSQSDDRHEKLKRMTAAWPNHLLQAHIYAYRFGIPVIWVFYINKNNQKREIRLQLYDPAIFDIALSYFKTAADFVRRGQLPDREESWFECKECVYRTLCQPTVLNKKRQLPTLPERGIRRR